MLLTSKRAIRLVVFVLLIIGLLSHLLASGTAAILSVSKSEGRTDREAVLPDHSAAHRGKINEQDFDKGAMIRVDEKEQRTEHDPANLEFSLLSKKALKKIQGGQSVQIQVRNANGMLSAPVPFVRQVECFVRANHWGKPILRRSS
jgi:hypothetical protein